MADPTDDLEINPNAKSSRERRMSRVLLRNEAEDRKTTPPISDEEAREIQARNWREIQISYNATKDPKAKKMLEEELDRGRGLDFPAEARFAGDTTASQRDVRMVDAANARRNAPDTEVPNVQVQSLSPTGNETIDNGLVALRNLYSENRNIIDSLIKDITLSSEAAAAEKDKAAAQVVTAGAAEAEAARLSGSALAAAAATKERILKVANLDTRQVDNAFAANLSKRVRVKAELDRMKPEIDARMSVGLFDDPLQYLINQTILPGQVAKYNALAQDYNNEVSVMDVLQRSVQTQESIDLGADADLLTRESMAVADAKAARAGAQAANLRSEASALMASKVVNIANLRERVMHNKASELQWEVTFRDRRDAAALKDNERKDREDKNRRLGIVGDMIGAEGVTIETLKGRGKDVQQDWVARADTLSLGDSVAESAEFVRKYGDLVNVRRKGRAEFADMLRAVQGAIDEEANNLKNTWGQTPETAMLAGKPPSDALARAKAGAKLQLQWEAQRDNDMFRASKVNPYVANHTKIARTWAGDKNNPVYIMSKNAADNGQVINDKVLIDATINLVRNKVLAPREAAAALRDYYLTVTEKNNEDRSLVALGLEKQTTYRVKPAALPRYIDLTNSTVTENFLTKELLAKELGNAGIAGMEGLVRQSVLSTSQAPLEANSENIADVVTKSKARK